MPRAEAEMDAMAKRHVLVKPAGDVKPVGIGEGALVADRPTR